jgi:hypothetical protein
MTDIHEGLALRNALAFARHGHAVFPIHGIVERAVGFGCACGRDCGRDAGKHPRTPNGLKDGTTDEATIRAMFVPGDNLGICTDNFLVVDIDPRHGGDKTWWAITRKHPSIGATWRVRTGGGGEHIFFKAPASGAANSVGKIGRGVDTRGRGGYVVGPGSRHISGRDYIFFADCHPKCTRLAEAPDWLFTITKKDKAPRPASFFRELASVGVDEGNRHEALRTLIGHLFGAPVMPDPDLVRELIHGWNEGRCRPPYDHAKLDALINDIAMREMQSRGMVK